MEILKFVALFLDTKRNWWHCDILGASVLCRCFMDGHTNGTNGSFSKSCGPLTDYYIPDYILKPEYEQCTVDHAPCCPVVVFINSRSGGQLGSSLIKTYHELLNEAQVFYLSEEAPDKAMHRLYVNFEKLKSQIDVLLFKFGGA